MVQGQFPALVSYQALLGFARLHKQATNVSEQGGGSERQQMAAADLAK